jgi:hypothetical protein
MAGKKISELPVATAPTGTELMEVVQGGVNKQLTAQDIADLGGGGGTSIPYGTTAGTNTYTITATPTVTGYANGLFLIKIGTSSTNASTLNFDSVGALKVYERPNKQITAGDFEAGMHYLVQHDSALDGGTGGFIVVGDLNHERLTYRGGYDVSSNLFPSTGGSGPSGGLRTGDFWVATNTGTLGSTAVSNRDLIINIDGSSPGQTAGNWAIISGVASVDTKLALKANTTDVVGVKDLPIPAQAMWPRVTSGCSVLTQYEMGTSLLNLQGLEFSSTVQQFAQMEVPLPRAYTNGVITAVIHWKPLASGSGDVRWGIQLASYRNDDALTTAFGTEVAVTDTFIATDDLHITTVSGTITPSGTLAAGNLMALQINRDPTNGSDTLDVNAILLSVVVRLTMSAAKDA